jgi:hypothetical protein
MSLLDQRGTPGMGHLDHRGTPGMGHLDSRGTPAMALQDQRGTPGMSLQDPRGTPGMSLLEQRGTPGMEVRAHHQQHLEHQQLADQELQHLQEHEQAVNMARQEQEKVITNLHGGKLTYKKRDFLEVIHGGMSQVFFFEKILDCSLFSMRQVFEEEQSRSCRL